MSNANDFVIENGVLIQYTGPGGDVVIPDGITAIGERAFFMREKVESVWIPEGVETIEGDTVGRNISGAFSYCINLKKVVLPESLRRIGCNAFAVCKKLEEINIPQSVTKIGANCFLDCKALTRCCIQNPDCEAELHVFSGSGVEELTVPVKTGFFLRSCGNLKTLTFTTGLNPEWVERISDSFSMQHPAAFIAVDKDCQNIERVYAPYCDIGRLENLKTPAALGFAHLVAQGTVFGAEIEGQYEAYIKKQRKKLYPLAVKEPDLLAYMISRKIIPANQIEECLALALAEGNTESVAALLDYQQSVLRKKR